MTDAAASAALAALLRSCSNAGRWGADDELGTLNFITPAKRVAAAAEVREGIAVGIGALLEPLSSGAVRRDVLRWAGTPAGPGLFTAEDVVAIRPHGYEITHMDAVGHVSAGDLVYNDRRVPDAMTSRGLEFGSIDAMRDGIFTRGVLLDVAAARGVLWLEPGEGVTPADLDRAESLAGTRVSSGDAIVVRVGLGARVAAQGPEDTRRRAGLVPECLPWLHAREVAVYSGDCVEQVPSGHPVLSIPLHQIGLAAMGLAMLDCPDVEALRAAAANLGRSSFLLVCNPLRIKRGSGSAVNPVCVF